MLDPLSEYSRCSSAVFSLQLGCACDQSLSGIDLLEQSPVGWPDKGGAVYSNRLQAVAQGVLEAVLHAGHEQVEELAESIGDRGGPLRPPQRHLQLCCQPCQVA